MLRVGACARASSMTGTTVRARDRSWTRDRETRDDAGLAASSVTDCRCRRGPEGRTRERRSQANRLQNATDRAAVAIVAIVALHGNVFDEGARRREATARRRARGARPQRPCVARPPRRPFVGRVGALVARGARPVVTRGDGDPAEARRRVPHGRTVPGSVTRLAAALPACPSPAPPRPGADADPAGAGRSCPRSP